MAVGVTEVECLVLLAGCLVTGTGICATHSPQPSGKAQELGVMSGLRSTDPDPDLNVSWERERAPMAVQAAAVSAQGRCR